jgi:myo-inositol 2-dehydrogenase / D-chiro-inositol 1-dehydrogenase
VAGVRIGLVGCGLLAERGYLPALARARGVTLAAVADSVAERCRRAGVPSFASAGELIDSGLADALVLATPVAAHVPDAQLAAAAGLPVLVEKPPAADLAGAELLAGLRPAPRVGFNRRFEPATQRLRKQLPADGPLDLRLLLRVRAGSWRPYDVRDDVLLDLGPHLVDLALWLAGASLSSVEALVREKRASLELRFADGRGRARIELARNRPHAERFEARTDDGALVGRHRTGWRDGLLRRSDHPLVPSLTAQLEAFGRSVGGAQEPTLATAADGVAVLAVLDAARRSVAP